MRIATQKKIDTLYAQIALLVEKEKVYFDKKHPTLDGFMKNISHTKIEVAGRSPRERAEMDRIGAAIAVNAREQAARRENDDH